MKSSFARRAAIAVAVAIPAVVQAASFNEPPGGYGTISHGSITLSWSGGDGSLVYIGLANGPNDNLQEVTSLNGGYMSYPGNSATVEIPSSLPAGAYVFTIRTEKSPENFSSGFCFETCYPSSGTSAAPSPVASPMPSSADMPLASPGQSVPTATGNNGLGQINGTSPAGPTGVYGTNVTSYGSSSSSGVASPLVGFTGGVSKVGMGVGTVVAALGGVLLMLL